MVFKLFTKKKNTICAIQTQHKSSCSAKASEVCWGTLEVNSEDKVVGCFNSGLSFKAPHRALFDLES